MIYPTSYVNNPSPLLERLSSQGPFIHTSGSAFLFSYLFVGLKRTLNSLYIDFKSLLGLVSFPTNYICYLRSAWGEACREGLWPHVFAVCVLEDVKRHQVALSIPVCQHPGISNG